MQLKESLESTQLHLNQAESNFDSLQRQSKEDITRLREKLEDLTNSKKSVESSSLKKIDQLSTKLHEVQKQADIDRQTLQSQLDNLRSYSKNRDSE